MNEQKTLNSQRRVFFSKFGFGALAAGFLSATPLKFFIPKKKTEITHNAVSVKINPHAVKREKSGTASTQRELV